MRTLSFMVAFVAMSLFCVLSANAQNLSGTYSGTLSEISMNHNPYDDADGVTFTLVDYGNGSGILTGTVGPIGSMPGRIVVQMAITISGETLSATPKNSAGNLVLDSGTTMPIYTSSFSGKVEGNTIHFVLDTYAFEAFGVKMFPASVTFDGNK